MADNEKIQLLDLCIVYVYYCVLFLCYFYKIRSIKKPNTPRLNLKLILKSCVLILDVISEKGVLTLSAVESFVCIFACVYVITPG